jgi:hypothetical protein
MSHNLLSTLDPASTLFPPEVRLWPFDSGPLAENMKRPAQGRSFHILVAGPGIEPGSGGYEPPEVPLLYPAI